MTITQCDLLCLCTPTNKAENKLCGQGKSNGQQYRVTIITTPLPSLNGGVHIQNKFSFNVLLAMSQQAAGPACHKRLLMQSCTNIGLTWQQIGAVQPPGRAVVKGHGYL